MRKKELLKEIKNCMKTLNHDQISYLLNVHSSYITNDNDKAEYVSGMTLEEWTFLRIEKNTYERDCLNVIKLIDLIKQGLRYDELESFCESIHYTCKIV